MLEDLRHSIRLLTSRPGFSIPVILALGLGIGANTALFTVVNGLLLRPFPYHQPDRLVEIDQSRRDLPLPELRGVRSFESAGAFLSVNFPVGRSGESRNVFGFRVSPNLFTVLGIRPAIGRVFTPQDDGARVVLLTYDYWRRTYNDPQIAGRTLIIGDESYTIVGVLRPDFVLQVRDGNMCVPDRLTQGRVLARLSPGATPAQAEAEVTAILHALPPDSPASSRAAAPRVRPIAESFRPYDASTLLLLQAAVGLVFLITCANVGNLLVARAAARRREFAIRAAIGAGRGRILLQLMTESAMLGLAGGVTGLVLAGASLDFIAARLPGGLVRALRGETALTIDFRVLAFTAAASLVAVLFFGMAPAAGALRLDLVSCLRGSSSGSTPGRRRFAQILVAGEIALSLVLLAGAGLMLKSLAGLENQDLGFQAGHVLRAAIDLLPARYPRPAQRAAVFDEITGRIEALPGVEAAGLLAPQFFPFGGPRVRGARFEIEGLSGSDGEPRAEVYIANPAYLRAVRIPLLQGRWFTAADNAAAEPVAILSQSVARRWWDQNGPLGRRIRLDPGRPDSPWTTVIGIVGDVRNPVAADVQPTAYRPFAQSPRAGAVFMIRTARSPLALAEAVRAELRAVDPTVPEVRVADLEAATSAYISPQRFTTSVAGVFAALGLLLVAVGIYGVTRGWVAARIPEIGVRMALGADRGDVIRLVLAAAARSLALGLAAGIAGSFALRRVIAAELYGVSPLDPVVLSAVAALLAAVALLAAFLPARRAASIDPLLALRHE
jgi:putative ABC transport system permease protein